MICLFSSSRDPSTTDVLRWLHRLGETDVLRINSDQNAGDDRIDLDVWSGGFCFRAGGRLVDLGDLDAIWYRKGRDWLVNSFVLPELPELPDLGDALRRSAAREREVLSEYVHGLIASEVPALGSAWAYRLNKLQVLDAARDVGLRVPDYLVSNRPASLREFADRKGGAVVKAVSDGIYRFPSAGSRTGFFSYTELAEGFDQLDDSPSPSFLQQHIPKTFDLRIFYLAGEAFGMAILSQAHEQTRVDFRKYPEDRPNRSLPYDVPPEVVAKLRRLFDILKLDTGSVDMIVGEGGEHYFLEINPVGQFGMVSSACNFGIEEKVARHLIGLSRKASAVPISGARADHPQQERM